MYPIIKNLNKAQSWRSAMTICIGVLAAGGQSIVCVADKAATYGDYIQWDADETKIVPLEATNGIVALVSGDDGHLDPVLRGINVANVGSDLKKLLDTSEKVYKEAITKMVTAEFLTPRLLKREEYVAAISGTGLNPYMQELADDIADFELNCDLLLCGFDKNRKAYVISLRHPGVPADVTRSGFCAVGSGFEKAISRLLWSNWKRSYPVERVLFDAFDAKANAEMAVGVGYEWDAVILTSDHKRHEVPDEIKDLIEKAWEKWTRSPFHVKEKDDLEPPPKDWKEKLHQYIESIVPSVSKKMPSQRGKL